MNDDSGCECSRRQALRSLVGGSMLLPGILEILAADEGRQDPLAPRAPHFPARAKRVIFLYMSGGASHLESFDHKPKLFADAGKLLSSEGGHNRTQRKLLAPTWPFKRYGKCGAEVSDIFPQIGSIADELCLIRSMKSDHRDHVEATLGIHTGSVTFTRPSIGSWVSYGLGTVNRNLPSFMVIAPKLPYGGAQVWSSDFLPAHHQGTRVVPGPEPIADMRRRSASGELQEMELGLVHAFNERHLLREGADSVLAARVKSFETAFGMQREAPDAFDVERESDATLEAYGLERGETTGFGWQCLVARRLAERGVRFIEVIDRGSDNLSDLNWDAHVSMVVYKRLAQMVDRPIAALILDLKARGMLEDTLVVWTTEFGRTPYSEPNGRGRGHHPGVFCSWLAGAGVKKGLVYGASDELGINVAENQVHVHDFHATILHLLGFDHTKLTYRHAGRDFRLTDVHGVVVKDILA